MQWEVPANEKSDFDGSQSQSESDTCSQPMSRRGARSSKVRPRRRSTRLAFKGESRKRLKSFASEPIPSVSSQPLRRSQRSKSSQIGKNRNVGRRREAAKSESNESSSTSVSRENMHVIFSFSCQEF